jgi:hypothetical protein
LGPKQGSPGGFLKKRGVEELDTAHCRGKVETGEPLAKKGTNYSLGLRRTF